jgi:hypothetical protein
MRRWTCSPLRRIEDINDRLDAVDGLLAEPHVTGTRDEGREGGKEGGTREEAGTERTLG